MVRLSKVQEGRETQKAFEHMTRERECHGSAFCCLLNSPVDTLRHLCHLLRPRKHLQHLPNVEKSNMRKHLAILLTLVMLIHKRLRMV